MLDLKPSRGSVEQLRLALLVTVTGSERQAVFAALKERSVLVQESFNHDFPHDAFDWPPGAPSSLRVWLIRVESQRAPATAAAVARYQKDRRFEAVVMVGMAMGIQGRVKPGDVIAPVEVFSLSHNRETTSGRLTIPHLFTPEAVAVRRLQSVLDRAAPPFAFGVYTKQHACADSKIEDPDGELSRQIGELSPDIYSYEMEAEGFFSALRTSPIEGLLIKGVADFGGVPGGSATNTLAKKPAQEQATRNALAVVLAYLDHVARNPVVG